MLLVTAVLGCNSTQKAKPKSNIVLDHFIDSVQLYSRPHVKAIALDTLNAEHFPVIPFPFFKKYYSERIKSTQYNLSTPPNDNIYWRFSFLTFERGKEHDFQTIIGYFEESGTYIYLVVLDKLSHEIINIQEIAYSGGDGPYYETDVLIHIAPNIYTNLHTVGETDEISFEEDSIRTNLLIHTLRLKVNVDSKLKVDTISTSRRVELSYNESNQRFKK